MEGAQLQVLPGLSLTPSHDTDEQTRQLPARQPESGCHFKAGYKRLELQIGGLEALTTLILMSVSESTRTRCLKSEQSDSMILLCIRKADWK